MNQRAYKEFLRQLLEDNIDEIPPQIEHSEGGSRIKARKGWFTAVLGYASVGYNTGMYDGRASILYRDFVQHLEQKHVRDIKDYRMTREDIDKANELLRAIMDEL